MKFSKSYHWSLAFVLTFLLLSCSESKDAIKAPSLIKTKPQQNKPITITICALKDHSFEVALKLIKESNFEKENNIEIKTVLLGFEPMLRAHEMDLASEKSTFDLVSIDQPSLGQYVSDGWVQTIDPFIANNELPSLNLNDVIPVLRQSCGEWQGKFYAVPLGSYGALLAYRKDILKAAGLKPPKTFSDFKKVATTVNSPPNLYGTALFAHLGEYITADSAPFLWSWGSGLINGCDVSLKDQPLYRAAWDSPSGIAALEFYASLYKEGLTHPNTLNFDHERYIGAFQSGKVAMGIMPAEGIGAPMEDQKKIIRRRQDFLYDPTGKTASRWQPQPTATRFRSSQSRN
jgi:multiple sugar transport system substrate-binding protein